MVNRFKESIRLITHSVVEILSDLQSSWIIGGRLFRQDEDGRRPCFGFSRKFQEDPHWRGCLLFNEYYHGDTGQGLGASHQTGWSGMVANLIDEWRR